MELGSFFICVLPLVHSCLNLATGSDDTLYNLILEPYRRLLDEAGPSY